jgi:hypothetical protein
LSDFWVSKETTVKQPLTSRASMLVVSRVPEKLGCTLLRSNFKTSCSQAADHALSPATSLWVVSCG